MRVLLFFLLACHAVASWDLLVELLCATGSGRTTVEHLRRVCQACRSVPFLSELSERASKARPTNFERDFMRWVTV